MAVYFLYVLICLFGTSDGMCFVLFHKFAFACGEAFDSRPMNLFVLKDYLAVMVERPLQAEVWRVCMAT